MANFLDYLKLLIVIIILMYFLPFPIALVVMFAGFILINFYFNVRKYFMSDKQIKEEEEREKRQREKDEADPDYYNSIK